MCISIVMELVSSFLILSCFVTGVINSERIIFAGHRVEIAGGQNHTFTHETEHSNMTIVTVKFEEATTSNQTASPIPKCKSTGLGDGHLDRVGKQEKLHNRNSTQETPGSSYFYLSVNVSLMVMSVCYLLYMNF